MGGKRLKAGGLKVELRALKTLETKMDKVPGGRRVGDGGKIGFRRAQLAGLYWGIGDRWNGYTGMERVDPPPKTWIPGTITASTALVSPP